VKYWPQNPSRLNFTHEIVQVGYALAGATPMPTVKEATATEANPEDLQPNEIDPFLSTTARLTADALFQVLSDGQYLYLFRQAIAPQKADNTENPNMVYKLQSGGSSGKKDHSDILHANGNPVPIVDRTLLLDRFVLNGTTLQPKMEVRYKRSRNKTRPANRTDSLGAKDINGNPFYEPTQELDFVRQLQHGSFQVLLLPTQVANLQRWQIFAHNGATDKIDTFNVERAADGLFNPKGTILYTSPDPEYQDSVYERRPGKCPFTQQDLAPILSTEGSAESALRFDGSDDYVDLGTPAHLKIAGSQTLEVWLKPVSFEPRQSILAKVYNGEGAITLEVDGKLSYYYGSGGNNPAPAAMDARTFQGILSDFGLVKGEWSHIAIVRDCENKKLFWYIDGVAAGEEDMVFDAAVAGDEHLFLGKGDASYFTGSIDEVRIWNRARSLSEIQRDRHHRLIGREPGLVGYWRLDEASGTKIYDQTDLAQNGTIHGATWETSDALIGDHPGLSRSSFSFSGRTLAPGITAVQYFQQEDTAPASQQGGNGQTPPPKPLKTSGRVMLAVPTGGPNPVDGTSTTNQYIAALDFAVSREGQLAQVPDRITLEILHKSSIDLDAISQERKKLSSESESLKERIAALQSIIKKLKAGLQSGTISKSDFFIKDLLNYNWDKNKDIDRKNLGEKIYLNILINQGMYKTKFGNSYLNDWWDERLPYAQYDQVDYRKIWDTRSYISGLLQRVSSSDKGQFNTQWKEESKKLIEMFPIFSRIFKRSEQLIRILGDKELWHQQANEAYQQHIEDQKETQTKIKTNESECQKKQQELRNKQSRLQEIKNIDKSGTALYMSLLDTDRSGLTVSGALLGFAYTQAPPQLFDSATGKLGLYFQGANQQFFTAYYDTKTARSQQELAIAKQPPVRFIARSVGPDADATIITISADTSTPPSTDRCTVTIANTKQGIHETWAGVPRAPQQFARVLNGQANPLYVGKANPITGTVTALTLVEATNRKLSPGDILQIGDAQVTPSAAVEAKATTIPIHSAYLNLTDYTPVYWVPYDYGANASIAASALSLNGTSDYVEIPAHNNPTQALTVSLWAKSATDTWSNYGCLLSKRSAYILHPTKGSKEIAILMRIDSKDYSVEHTPTIDLKQWHHYAASFDGKTIRLYIDGQEVAAEEHAGAIKSDNGMLLIGKDEKAYDQHEDDRYFHGQIDEVRIWDRARSAAEIKADMKRRLKGNEPGLVGYWHFEGGNARDYSRQGNNGIIHGTPDNIASPIPFLNNPSLSLHSRHFFVTTEANAGTIANGTAHLKNATPACRWVADAPGQALSWPATNRFLALPDAKLASMAAVSHLTVEAWVHPVEVQQIARIVHYRSSATNQYTLALQQLAPDASPDLNSSLRFNGVDNYVQVNLSLINTLDTGFTLEGWIKPSSLSRGSLFGQNDVIEFGLDGNKLSVWTERGEVETPYPGDGQWHHVAAVGDETHLALYIDGVEKQRKTDLSAKTNVSSASKFQIGAGIWKPTANSDRYTGQIAEVRVWSVARSAAQTQVDMYRQLSGDEPGLLGYWRFEAGIARDYSGNGYDGELKGNPQNGTNPPLRMYYAMAGVGDRWLKTREHLFCGTWNHLACSYHQSYALRFDGNDSLDCGKNRMLNLCDDLTIEAVVQLPGTSGAILSKGQPGAGIEKESMPYALRIDNGKVIFSFEDSNGTLHELTSTSAIRSKTIHKLAVTRKKITEANDSGADPKTWGTEGIKDITPATLDSKDSDIEKAMKADYVASKKRGKDLKEQLKSQQASSRSSDAPSPSSLISKQTQQWLELALYVDGKRVSSAVLEPAVAPAGNSQPLEIGKAGSRYLQGILAEVRLWSRALEGGELSQKLTGQEKGLVAWWQFEENEGNLANDRKGGNHAQIKGATWCKNPDLPASELLLYVNGIPQATEALATDDALRTSWGAEQFTLGACKQDDGTYTNHFQGTLEEVRVWKVARTQEQILDNLFTRLKGEKRDLLANYTFDDIDDTEVKDSSLAGNHLPLGAKAQRPDRVLSDAPISNDTAQVRSALAGIHTAFHETIDSSPAVAEYGDMQYDSQQNLIGVFKRCYTYIQDGKWQLNTGYKVGNLVTEWVSQVQFDPQIIGYIEGAPPVPSENLTTGPITAAETYADASSVELIEADNVAYTFSSSKENGFNSSFEASMAAGVELDLRTLLAPLGFGVSFKADVKFSVNSEARFDASGSWTDEKSASQGRNVSRNMRASLRGYWEDRDNPLNLRLGPRYVPNNRGFALVQSETADVYALRLAHNHALISYQFQPNPDIPKDWNIISFPINPRYTKQGTLDGKVGLQPDGSVQTDPDYPQATQYGQYSYFKPIETYALKRQLDREAEELRTYYQTYNASPLSQGILKNVMGTNAGLLASATAAVPIGGIGVGAGTTFGSLADALTKDQSLPDKFATRNLANTYVWTADGGFYAETTDIMAVR